MPPIDNAIAWAFERYNNQREFRASSVEIGNVLWATRATQSLVPGADILGSTGSAVAPYTPGDFLKLLGHLAGQGDEFLGDVHCHVRASSSWLGHYPSPTDIASESCLCDHWPLVPPVSLGSELLTHLPIASQFQIVQTNLFGDLFVVEATNGRVPFISLAQQMSGMTAIESAFLNWHRQANVRLGPCGGRVSHSIFVKQANAELGLMNAALGGRATIRFLTNDGFVSDSSNFLAT